MEKIKISIVSYLNTLPFEFGLENHPIKEHIQLQKDIPSICAARLINGEVDLALVPVAAVLQLPKYHIVEGFGIGASGKVDSVLLLSYCPLAEIESIMLDYQSKTSVALCQVLAKEYWKISPMFEETHGGYETTIKGHKAAVVIGDRALAIKDKFPFVYDLSEEWMKYTNLPFLFAAWVSNKVLDNHFLDQFEEALNFGLSNIDQAINKRKDEFPFSLSAIEDYLKLNIKHKTGLSYYQAMALFLQKLVDLHPKS